MTELVPFASFKVPGTTMQYSYSWRKVPEDLACENKACTHRKDQHAVFGAKGLHKCDVKGCTCKDFVIDKSKLQAGGGKNSLSDRQQSGADMEITTVNKAHSKYSGVKTPIPATYARDLGLEPGVQISWEIDKDGKGKYLKIRKVEKNDRSR